MNLLLAEDDNKLGKLMKYVLEKKGNYHVDWVDNGEDAFQYARAAVYDVCIIDWMMPGVDGIEVCKRLRALNYSQAILLLTAKDSLQDKIVGLDAGADDYLTKPFEMEELLARLRSLTRRNYAPLQQDITTFGEFTLNRSSRQLFRCSEEILLSQREYQLLDLLVQNEGNALTREVILDRIWGIGSDVSYKNVDVTIKMLRNKLEAESGGKPWIQSVRGGLAIDLIRDWIRNKAKKKDVFIQTQKKLTMTYAGLIILFLVLFAVVAISLMLGVEYKEQRQSLQSAMYASEGGRPEIPDLANSSDQELFFYYILDGSDHVIAGSEAVPMGRSLNMAQIAGWHPNADEYRLAYIRPGHTHEPFHDHEREQGFKKLKRDDRLLLMGPVLSKL
ncbi:response regulator transcription factor [Paenibacillus hexagrammi]|uniref:response regulator transcription factor n=1 Tax=Paenibacillus hexagrammi TaxID=2908839 RepID=UPI00386215B7